ncbi:5894_t:CDS:2, partial [Dentiscutata heterogama]
MSEFDTALIAFLYVGHFYYKYFTRVNKLPGPFPIPIIGSLWNKRDGYNKWILKLQQQYGDVFEVWLSNKRKLSEWMQRFTIDMIIEITTGKRAYTLPVYFNKFTTKKIIDIPPAILDDSEYFIHNVQKMHHIAHSASRLNIEPDELLGYQWPARSEFIMFFEGGNKNP